MILSTVQGIVEVARYEPERTLLRVRINNNSWELLTGAEFLELWEEPFAGTIYVDSLYLDGKQRMEVLRAEA